MQGSMASEKVLGDGNWTWCPPTAHRLCGHHAATMPSAPRPLRSVLPDYSAVAPPWPFLLCSSKTAPEGYKQGASISSLGSFKSFLLTWERARTLHSRHELPPARNGAPPVRPTSASRPPAGAGLSAPGTQQVLRACLAQVRPPGGQPAGRLWRRDPQPGPKNLRGEAPRLRTRPLKNPPRDCRRFSGLFWDLSPLGSEFTSTVAGSTPGAGSLASCLMPFCLWVSAAAFLSLDGPSLPFWPAAAASGCGGATTFSVGSEV